MSMTEKPEAKAPDVIAAYQEQLIGFREKLAWVKDYL